jgi:hypothetical protein
MTTQTTHRLRITPRAAALKMTADDTLERAYRMTWEGAEPRVREGDDEIDIDYTIGGRLRAMSPRRGTLAVALNPAVPWTIQLRGGVSGLRADLRELEVSGGNDLGRRERRRVRPARTPRRARAARRWRPEQWHRA